ncbi:MAG: Cof-type HAD-IIB family hydrolase [Paenibacillus lautus]|jgi:Cof subfamily protein (haloacid dehalogenase superfamily)|uniref:HAD family hydrolase n=1 Tax=Paenibacillus lautus TaxID=1401 RepID=UPI0010D38507|nr:HAD family hydrolase [Paenibacillus lautus]MCI1778309.1 Cof-type HAD-IIB family hydrolase [Paenibacillus lautus]VTR32910.1 phosphatase [Actinobacillus pleuropneumoniae]
MKKRAYITDLDGTLLRSDQSLSPYTMNVITDALERDFIVTFATARGYISAKSVVSDISWKYPVILYNGALIYDWLNQTVVDGYWLERDISNEIIGVGRKHGITPFYFSLDKDQRERVLHETLRREGEMSFYAGRPHDPRFLEVNNLNCPPDYRTLALTYIGLHEELEPIRQEVTTLYGDVIHAHMMPDYYIRNHYFLEFSHAKANKRDGLQLWSAHMGIDLENTVVFGDHINDVGLFEAGGTRIAVRNAHETIQQLADHIIDSNELDGVAHYIEQQMELAGNNTIISTLGGPTR